MTTFPCDKDKEKSILSLIILHPSDCDSVFKQLEIKDFFDLKNQRIYDACRQLWDADKSIEISTITKKMQELKHRTDSVYLLNLGDWPIANSAQHHIDIIKEKRALRDIMTICNESIKMANIADPKELIQDTVSQFSAVEARITGRNKSNKLTESIREWVMTTSAYWKTTDLQNGLHLTTRAEKKHAAVVLVRLCKEGILEKSKTTHGQYRRIEDDAPDIDIFNVDSDRFPMELPLSLHFLYKAMPKNIIIVAGTPNAGKTAFTLNAAAANTNKGYKVCYQSSEMGAEELRSRLMLFEDYNLDHFKDIRFREVSHGWQDYIIPNGLNIIDYLEIGTDFFKVGETIRLIFDKLKKGVAIIALQKKKGAEMGRGAEFSLEKPRLYVTMDKNENGENEAKIVKCKNFVDPKDNPNGKTCTFKLYGGINFQSNTLWT